MTIQQFIAFVSQKRSAEFVTFYSVTDPRLLKTGNPFRSAMKHTEQTAIIGFDYQNSVNNQLEREGEERDFIAQPRQCGQRISVHFVQNKGKFYLSYKGESVKSVRYMNGNVQINDADIEPFKPKAYEPIQGGQEKTIIYRDIALDNIRWITMRGMTIEIVA